MSDLKVLIKPMLDKSATKRMQTQLGKTTAKTPTSRAGGGATGGVLAGAGIGKALAGIAATLAIAATGIGLLVLGVGVVLKRLAQSSPMLAGVLDMFKVAINMFLLPIGNMIAKWLVPLAKSAIRFAQGFNKVFGEQGFWGAMTWALKTVLTAWGKTLFLYYKGLFDTMTANIVTIKDYVKNLPSNIAKALKSGVKSATETAKAAVSDPMGTARDVLGALGGMVPKFAEGGIATKPTMGVFGEAGPEAIIPLDRLQSGITIQFNGNVYGMNDFERQVQTIVNRYGNRRNYA